MKMNPVIEMLNEAVSLEYGALHMYLQFSFLVHGQDRIKWQDLFEEKAKESLGHAKLFAGKIVAYGAVPTVQPLPLKQSQDLGQMLEIAVEVEKRAVEVYSKIHAAVEGRDQPLQYLLEQQILDEQNDAEEMEKFVRRGNLEAERISRAA